MRNTFIRDYLNAHFMYGFDGEVIVGDPHGDGVFARSTSGVMSGAGEPDFYYWVFDWFTYPSVYADRLQHLEIAVNQLREQNFKRINFLGHQELNNPEEVIAYEQKCHEIGYEGIMLNRTNAQYKHGRSTLGQQILIKMKRWEDAEATVVGFTALERNQNQANRNALGLTERSDHKSGKVTDSLLGNLICSHRDYGEFGIGSGFDVTLRREIWENQAKYLGKKVTFKFMPIGTLEKPRFPIFKGFREDI